LYGAEPDAVTFEHPSALAVLGVQSCGWMTRCTCCVTLPVCRFATLAKMDAVEAVAKANAQRALTMEQVILPVGCDVAQWLCMCVWIRGHL